MVHAKIGKRIVRPPDRLKSIGLLLLVLGLAACNHFLNPDHNLPPVAGATAAPMAGATPLNVTFTGSGVDPDGSVASSTWAFGDGSSASTLSPVHTYRAAGTFLATLTVTDNKGATDSTSLTISVTQGANQAPTVTASATPTTGLAPLNVQFTAAGADADGTVASYAWVFGDGGMSAQQNPAHTYAAAGTFAATVTVTDNKGATGTATVSVTVGTAANKPPTAAASASPTSGTVPFSVTFTGSGTDPDGTISAYAWTFGDGGTSTAQSPTHVYTAAGNFTATLRVTDNGGATGSASVNIAASAPGNQPPSATASAAPTTGTAPLAVTFTGGGTDPDGTIASYTWSFGDGGTSTQQSPSHTYAAAGNYTATLTVTDNAGATGSAAVAITVRSSNQAPIANAGPDQVNLDTGVTVTLDGTGSLDPDGGTLTYQWTQTAGPAVTLSGGTTSRPTFGTPLMTTATFTFQLTVTDNGSPPASGSDTVNVTSRVTYNNTIAALFANRGSNRGCVQCHAPGGQRSQTPLTNYQQVYSFRTSVRSVIQSGGSMRQYLATGEPAVVTAWIDAGAPN